MVRNRKLAVVNCVFRKLPNLCRVSLLFRCIVRVFLFFPEIYLRGVSKAWQRLVAQVLNSRRKLASRKSAPEQQAVPSLRTPNEWIWISLNRDPSTKRLWMCVDGSRVSYTRWNDMETNNSGGKEDCGHVMSIERRRRWNDRHCATLSL